MNEHMDLTGELCKLQSKELPNGFPEYCYDYKVILILISRSPGFESQSKTGHPVSDHQLLL